MCGNGTFANPRQEKARYLCRNSRRTRTNRQKKTNRQKTNKEQQQQQSAAPGEDWPMPLVCVVRVVRMMHVGVSVRSVAESGAEKLDERDIV
eukprot:m.801627 g.801627  ORF g.801627 m.801627 type:complete len:92 (-) comp59272_c0_seq61:37-312(-)